LKKQYGAVWQQQMVAIARGWMAEPEVLLVDESSLGLSLLLRQQLAEKIKGIHNEGVTVVLVEQNARLGLMLDDYAYVMENGELLPAWEHFGPYAG
jgi:branched-chain amino acid transport system ATP-binding protein